MLDMTSAIDKHVLDAAGLGKPPYSIISVTNESGSNCANACSLCGTAIVYVYRVVSSDGVNSKLGSDCIEKTHDGALIEAYKANPDYVAIKVGKAKAKDDRVIAQWKDLINDQENRDLLAKTASNLHTSRPDSLLQRFEREWEWKKPTPTSRARNLKNLISALAYLKTL